MTSHLQADPNEHEGRVQGAQRDDRSHTSISEGRRLVPSDWPASLIQPEPDPAVGV